MSYPVDWSRLVLVLRSHGYPFVDQAKRAGVSTHTIFNLCSGTTTDPKWSAGMELLLLYRQATGAEVPMIGDK